MTTKEDLIGQWMSTCEIDRDTAWSMLVEEANGFRTVWPEELAHLTAQEARELDRREGKRPPETADETALYSSILIDAGISEDPLNLGKTT